MIIHFSSIQFMFINVPSQQPDGQLQKQHITIIIIIVVVVVVLYLTHLSNRNVLQKFRNLPDSTTANKCYHVRKHFSCHQSITAQEICIWQEFRSHPLAKLQCAHFLLLPRPCTTHKCFLTHTTAHHLKLLTISLWITSFSCCKGCGMCT